MRKKNTRDVPKKQKNKPAKAVTLDAETPTTEPTVEDKPDTPDNPKPKLSLGEKIANWFAPYSQILGSLEKANDEVKRLEDELNEKNEKINNLQREKGSLESENEALTQKREDLNDIIRGWETAAASLPQIKAADHKMEITRVSIETSDKLKAYAGEISDSIAGLVRWVEKLQEEKQQLKEEADTAKTAAAKKVEAPSIDSQLRSLDSKSRGVLIKPYILSALRSLGVEIVSDSVDESVMRLKKATPAINLDDYVPKAEFEKVRTERDNLRKEVSEKIDPKDRAQVLPFLIHDLNAKIDEEEKKLNNEREYDELMLMLSTALLKPDDIDKALAQGEKSVLDEVRTVVGPEIAASIEDVKGIKKALADWYRSEVESKILPKFNAYKDGMVAKDVAKAANEALAVKGKADEMVEQYGVDAIEKVPAAVRDAAFEKIYKDMIENESSPYQLTKEMREALAKSKHLQGAITALSKYGKAKAEAVAKAEEAREEAVNAKDSLEKAVVEAAKEAVLAYDLDLEGRDSLEVVKQAGSFLNERISEKDNAIKKKDTRIMELDNDVKQLKASLATKDDEIAKIYGKALGLLDRLIGDIDASIKGIVVGGNREKPVPKAVDERIINNDFYGFDEFKEQVEKNLSALDGNDLDKALAAIKDTFIECLKIPSATWIDNLGRLYLYSKVPFIADQFMGSRVNIEKISAAFGLLEAMLGALGIKLIYPSLFVDTFVAGEYESETIKNISGMVSDIASHVDDEETIVDIFTLGFSVDGVKKLSPVVSRLNK